MSVAFVPEAGVKGSEDVVSADVAAVVSVVSEVSEVSAPVPVP